MMTQQLLAEPAHFQEWIFAIRSVSAIMWITAGFLAWWVRRWMLAIAFPLAGLNSIYSAYAIAQGPVGGWWAYVSATLSPLIVALICTSFISNQARGPRPDHWTR